MVASRLLAVTVVPWPSIAFLAEVAEVELLMEAIESGLVVLAEVRELRGDASTATQVARELEATLDRLGVRRWPSEANFVLADFGDRHQQVCADLKARGVLVRDRSHEVEGAVRLGVGTKEQTARLIAALEELVQ